MLKEMANELGLSEALAAATRTSIRLRWARDLPQIALARLSGE
jgi:hypothetical protein